MSEYDVREATAILKKACSDRDYDGRSRAAGALEDAIVQLVSAAGSALSIERTKKGTLNIRRGNTQLVAFSVQDHGVLAAAEENSDFASLAIEYDGERFVGTDEDTYLHPVPGEPRRQRAATAVIAMRLAEAIAEKYPR